MPALLRSPCRRGPRFPWLGILLVLSLAGCGKNKTAPKPESPAETETRADHTWTVRQGSFTVVLQLDGTLDAIKHHEIKCPADGRLGLDIIEVMADHTPVKKGQVVARFSPQNYELRRKELAQQLEDETMNLRLAEQDAQMQSMANLANLKGGNDALKQAQEAYERYEVQDAPLQKRGLIAAIEDATQALGDAQELAQSDKLNLSKATFQDAAQVAQLQTKVDSSTKLLNIAKDKVDATNYSLKVFKQYDYGQKKRMLKQGLDRAQIEMQRQLLQAATRTVQNRRAVAKLERRVQKVTEDLRQIDELIDGLTLVAPINGILSLGNSRRGQIKASREIIVGTAMRANEILGTIPELTQFLVVINIPEFHRSRVQKGLPATITVRALPGLTLNGQITLMADMASNLIDGDPSSPKIYKTELSTDTTDPRLMPGMTVMVDIRVEQVDQVLFVPVEALYLREGRSYCRVQKPTGETEEREVVKGRWSDHYVEIVSGLQEGDAVLLQRMSRNES
jgi:HlyD family secretion protein